MVRLGGVTPPRSMWPLNTCFFYTFRKGRPLRPNRLFFLFKSWKNTLAYSSRKHLLVCPCTFWRILLDEVRQKTFNILQRDLFQVAFLEDLIKYVSKVLLRKVEVKGPSGPYLLAEGPSLFWVISKFPKICWCKRFDKYHVWLYYNTG